MNRKFHILLHVAVWAMIIISIMTLLSKGDDTLA